MRRNIVFNFASRFLTALSTFLFIPFYVGILGQEGYSVIALSIVVASMVLIFEMGLSSAIAREMARNDITDAERRRSFAAIERVFALVLLIIAVAAISLSDFIAIHLVGGTKIDREILAVCILLIMFEAGLQLMMRFHINVLMGLERQIQANVFIIVWTVLRNGVVIGVISFCPDLTIFFAWQMTVTAALSFALKVNSLKLVHAWPISRVKFFDTETLVRLRGFAIGMMLISLVAVANTQLDRIMIGSFGLLNDLGVYTLAASIGSAILFSATPVMSAVLPRLTIYCSAGQISEARVLFRRSTRLIALIILPIVVVVSSRSEAVLFAWLGEPDLARSAALIAPWLVIGYATVGLATIPYALAVANGNTRINNAVGIASLAVSIPGYYLALQNFGVIGVAAVFMAVQIVSNLLISWFIMKRYLNGGTIKHHIESYAVPALSALLGSILFQYLVGPMPEERLLGLLALAAELAFCGFVTVGLSWGVWKLADARSPSDRS